MSSMVRASQIVVEVAIKHGLTVDELRGPRRLPWFVEARREAASRLYNEIPLASFPFVGLCLNRHHTSVMNLLGLIVRNGQQWARKVREAA